MKKYFIKSVAVFAFTLAAAFCLGGTNIAHAQVSSGSVTCDTRTDCETSVSGVTYEVSFTTDNTNDASQIQITFPDGYTITNSSLSILAPDGTPSAINIDGTNVGISGTSVSGNTVDIDLNSAADLSTGTVGFQISDTGTSITNPNETGTTGDFTIDTDASEEAAETDIAGVTITNPFTITDSSVSGVSSGDLVSGINGAQYHIGINTAASFNSNGNEGSIAVTFPTGYFIPQGSIPTSDICALQSSDCGYVYGGGNPSYSITSVSGSRNTITVNFDSSHGGNDTNYGFYMQAGAGIRNPSTVGTTEFFKIAADGGIPATAGSVTITSPVPQVTDGSVTCVTTNDCAAGAFGTYDVSFLSTNSSVGAVQITFPSGYPPENTTPVITTEAGRSNYITVNGTDYQIMGANVSGNTLTVYFQSNIDLTAGTVSFRFGPSNPGSPVGIANPVTLGQTGNFSITTDASGETPESDIPGVTITTPPNPFSDFAVSGNSANDLFSGTGPSIYKVSFTAAAHISNSTLAITFPSGYSLPQGSLSVNAIDGFGGPLNFNNGQSYGYFYIFIPGWGYSGIPINSFSVSGNTMTISLGSAYSEGANEQVQFYLMDGSHGSSNAGITNPSTPETTGDFSLSFNGDTPVTAPGVTITPEPIATKFMVSDSNDDNGGTIGLQAGRSGNFTIVATDANGNIAPGYDPTGKTFTFTDSNGVLLSTYISPNGTAPTIPQSSDITSAVTHGNAFVPITLTKAGTVGPITVSDGTLSGTSDPVFVGNDDLETTFSVIPSTTTPVAGTPFSLTVSALDLYGNVQNSLNTRNDPYNGQIIISTTATAPYNLSPSVYFFTPSDNGTKTFTNGVTLNTAENGVLMDVSDFRNGTPSTSPSINVEAAPASSGGGGGGGVNYGGGSTASSNSAEINDGALTTATQTVTLSLFSSSATRVMVSGDPGFAGATWQPYSITKPWTLPGGSGRKTVYVKFMDAYGSVSSVSMPTITVNPSAAIPGQPAPASGACPNGMSYASSCAAPGPAPAPAAFARNLRRGMAGPDVALLQRYLGTHGFPVTAIGHETKLFGPTTQRELKAFQKSAGLSADGSFGPATRAYANAHQ